MDAPLNHTEKNILDVFHIFLFTFPLVQLYLKKLRS